MVMVLGRSANAAVPPSTPGISQSKNSLVVPVYSKSKVTVKIPPSHSEVSITRSKRSHSSSSQQIIPIPMSEAQDGSTASLTMNSYSRSQFPSNPSIIIGRSEYENVP